MDIEARARSARRTTRLPPDRVARRNERDASADEVVKRLRAKLSKEPGAQLFMTPVQDLRIGARSSDSQFEYSIKADELSELRQWEPKLRRAMAKLKELEDINNDYEDRGLQTSLVIDRDAVARLGLPCEVLPTCARFFFSIATARSSVSMYFFPASRSRG